MKKYIAFFLSFCMLGLMAFPSFAYYTKTKSIPSVRVTVNTGDLALGDEVTDSADLYVSIPDNDYYELEDAEWLDDVRELKVGDAPRMQVTLTAIPKEVESANYSTIYLFTGTYTKNSISIKGGEYLAADRRDNGYTLLLTLRVKAVSGQFDAPYRVEWDSNRGNGFWETDFNDSGYYDVVCYRGSHVIKRLYDYHGTSYNFYPYMTQEGEYSFKVRTVPAPNSGVGKSSDWMESGSLYISASEVSDGSGQTTADEHGGQGTSNSNVNNGTSTSPYINGQYFGDTYGWISAGNYRYFRYPDGKLATGWLKLEEKWYHFDANGAMTTGWFQNKYGKWFYLDPSTGVMKTGWFNDNGNYYYLHTTKGDNEGAMVTGWADVNGYRYWFNKSGMMVTGWRNIDGKYYYFYPKGSTGSLYGHLATNTKVGDFRVGADGAWQP